MSAQWTEKLCEIEHDSVRLKIQNKNKKENKKKTLQAVITTTTTVGALEKTNN